MVSSWWGNIICGNILRGGWSLRVLRSSGLKVRRALRVFATSRMVEVFGVSKTDLRVVK